MFPAPSRTRPATGSTSTTSWSSMTARSRAWTASSSSAATTRKGAATSRPPRARRMTTFRSSAAAVVSAGCDPVEAALAFAADRHPVLPLHSPVDGECSCGDLWCESVGKHPRNFGLLNASVDPSWIGAWYMVWPLANLGLRCDGLWVLDVDANPARNPGSASSIGSACCHARAGKGRPAATDTTCSTGFRPGSPGRTRPRASVVPRGSMCEAGPAVTSSRRRASITRVRGMRWMITL